MKSLKRLGKFIIYMFLVLIGVSVYIFIYPPKDEPINMDSSANGACQIAVKRLDNDPSSLEFFHSRTTEIVKRKDGIWVVTIQFRGRNGFNATILSQATCYLRHDGDLWHILNVR
jgi:hypothetical protein